ncbi:hypothetical protein S40293_09545 [Stachybotrys chartarum IBT 40293]|nr:hypothetical protein S40293_09545 [Stachybotrys chartarum IBT 40293]
MAIIYVDIIPAVDISTSSPLSLISLVSASLEAVAWAILACFLAAALSNSFPAPLSGWFPRNPGIAFGYGLLICLIAEAASVVNVIYLSNAAHGTDGTVLGESKDNFVIASTAVLAASIVCQLIFLTIHLINGRRVARIGAECLYTGDKSQCSPKLLVNTVLCSQIHPLPTGISTQYRPSLGYYGPEKSTDRLHLAPRSSVEENIDARGMSPVDWCRHIHALGTSSPTYSSQHLLKSIPESPPITKRVKSDSVDLEWPPPVLQRRRSYGPVVRNPQQVKQSANTSSDELHIHPLFRSDSPAPWPVATPETSVVAKGVLNSIHSTVWFTKDHYVNRASVHVPQYGPCHPYVNSINAKY